MRSRAPTLPTTAGAVQAETGAKTWPAAAAPLLGELFAGGGGLQGGAAGIGDVIRVGLRRIPERHDAVADIFVDHAVVGRDRPAQRVEVARKPAGQELRLHGLAQQRETLDVGE